MSSKPWKQNDASNMTEVEVDVDTDEQVVEETDNSLAIVPATGNLQSSVESVAPRAVEEVSARQARIEEVESKISAWETEEMAKIHNRFKRVETVINRWEDQQVEKATACLRKVERKLEEEKARALERMQNDVAKARQKVEEKRSSVEAKRGEKVSRVLELAKMMKIVGRAPSKRSFF